MLFLLRVSFKFLYLMMKKTMIYINYFGLWNTTKFFCILSLAVENRTARNFISFDISQITFYLD